MFICDSCIFGERTVRIFSQSSEAKLLVFLWLCFEGSLYILGCKSFIRYVIWKYFLTDCDLFFHWIWLLSLPFKLLQHSPGMGDCEKSCSKLWLRDSEMSSGIIPPHGWVHGMSWSSVTGPNSSSSYKPHFASTSSSLCHTAIIEILIPAHWMDPYLLK